MNWNEIDIMKLTPEDYLKMHDRCAKLEEENKNLKAEVAECEEMVAAAHKKNAELSDTINRMDGGCKRAIELRRLLDELFEIKPNELVSDDQIRLKMKGLRGQCKELTRRNTQLFNQRIQLEEENENLKDRIPVLEATISNLSDRNSIQKDHIQEVEEALLTLARESENSAEHIKNLSFCITDVRKSAEKYHDEVEAYIKLKNQYRDKCNLLLEEKAELEKRLRDAEKENDELTKELAKKLYGDPLPRVHDADMYQRGALQYINPRIWKIHDRLIDGAMGMCGEAGEASEIIKKYAFQNHMLYVEHLASELGDVLWYVAYTADTIGYPLSRIMEINQEKLQSRYSDGKFNAERSRNRKEGDI